MATQSVIVGTLVAAGMAWFLNWLMPGIPIKTVLIISGIVWLIGAGSAYDQALKMAAHRKQAEVN